MMQYVTLFLLLNVVFSVMFYVILCFKDYLYSQSNNFTVSVLIFKYIKVKFTIIGIHLEFLCSVF
jgi:hypothetical protein